MKKYFALILTLVLLFSFTVAFAEMPMIPGGMNDFRQNKNQYGISSEPIDINALKRPEIDRDSLFSSRDLEQSPDLSGAVSVTAQDGSEYVITAEGIYVLTGKAENFTLKVEADKKDKVQIVLSGADIVNDSFPVIYIKSADKCFVTSVGENRLSVSGKFTADGNTNTDAVIFSKDDLTLNGTGALSIVSANGNGITTKDDLTVTGGSYEITCALDGMEAGDSIAICGGEFVISTKKDAFHCENDEQTGFIFISGGTFKINAADDGVQATSALIIDGGTFEITADEGLEATFVQINGGTIGIKATDDGINASKKCAEYDVVIEINGGDITVAMGPGDTDGIDANGIIIVNGGTVNVSGSSTFDSDMGSYYNGGTIIVNGQVTDTIPASMQGGRGGKGGFSQTGKGSRWF